MAVSKEETQRVEPRRPHRPAWRRILKWLVVAVILVTAGIYAWRYWRHSQLYVSTDDAYVNANVVQIAAQVSGPVTELYVRNQQHVQAGDALLQIDPRPFQLALDAAEAQLALARQQVEQDTSAVAAARALLAQRRAELQNAQSNYRRLRNLAQKKLVSPQDAEAARTEELTATAAVNAAMANLAQAQSALGKPGEQNAAVQAALAKVSQAKLDLERTRVAAPDSGTVANLTLRPGSTVQAEAPLFSVVSNQTYWVDANFKETQIDRIRPGQNATVTVDMYPNHPFRAEVQSLSAGSGTAFSLLPPENATGNWVKVTQRVPVRVRILETDAKHPLRIGTSATVEVRTG
ncbi:MAG TPA: HlyD family secretion protein [Gammaproteobacteria bacterium]|nr:HlyD family secretion protein [Gammaproteobacteria bacterium]